MHLALRGSFHLLLIAALIAAASYPASAADAGRASLNDGYSQFYNFCEQESHLSLLLWIKKSPADVSAFATRVSDTAKEDMDILKQFSANDSRLRLDKISLSSFETSVRSSMDADRQKSLIWDNSGAGFAKAMHMTQTEATNYGLHVAKVLSETETNPVRARAMKAIFVRWTALHEQAYALGS